MSWDSSMVFKSLFAPWQLGYSPSPFHLWPWFCSSWIENPSQVYQFLMVDWSFSWLRTWFFEWKTYFRFKSIFKDKKQHILDDGVWNQFKLFDICIFKTTLFWWFIPNTSRQISGFSHKRHGQKFNAGWSPKICCGCSQLNTWNKSVDCKFTEWVSL